MRATAGRLVVLAVTTALVLTGCASLRDGDGDSTRDSALPGGGTAQDAGTPVLQVSRGGGFMPMGYDFASVPELTLYGDGTLLSVGPQIDIFPGPALPNLLTSEVDAAEVAEILAAAEEAGLLTEIDYGMPPVADAGATIVSLTVDGTTYLHSAEALGLSDGTVAGEAAMGLTDEQVAARVALSEFLTDVRDRLGAGDGDAYDATAYAVMAQPAASTEPVDGEIERTVTTWPIDLSLADLSGCAVVEGEDATALEAALVEANTLTLWEQDGATYDAWVRPLLPGETDCAKG